MRNRYNLGAVARPRACPPKVVPTGSRRRRERPSADRRPGGTARDHQAVQQLFLVLRWTCHLEMLAEIRWTPVLSIARAKLQGNRRCKAGARAGSANAIDARQAKACGQHTPGY